jgi:putative transposase
MVNFMKKTFEGEFDLLLFTFMPDHLHLLLEGTSEKSNARRSVKLFKQLSGYWFKQKFGSRLCQKGYHDRILRGDEIPEAVAWYVLNNPVRKGLVLNPFDYPFSGSFVFHDLKQLDPQTNNRVAT